jgi:biopolymer transport protein TolQ
MPATQAGELVNQQIDQSLDELVHEEESYLPLVSTSAGVSTLLGLFGTIWGLIHAFIRISQMQSADIATVAPGIAEALITTLAGLMVAIPSTVMYNVLVVQVRKLEHKYLMLADKITMLFEPLFKN